MAEAVGISRALAISAGAARGLATIDSALLLHLAGQLAGIHSSSKKRRRGKG